VPPTVYRCVVAAVLLLLSTVAPATAVAHHNGKRNQHLGDRSLKPGHRGQDVRVAQRYLTLAGFETHVDGHYGGGTARSVHGFEGSIDRRPNGILTKHEAKLLRQVVAQRAEQRQAAATAPAPTPAAADRAQLTPAGLAIAPAGAPDAVKRIIAAGNEIAGLPYKYGGGHGSWKDSGYDCSGSVSYALHGGDLLQSPMPSGSFMDWGEAGPGRWVTIYANGGHMYMEVAGLRFDTSARRETGGRWTTTDRDPSGYVVRHPAGL
jgi:cell wall-associated NlpC family hydrolase